MARVRKSAAVVVDTPARQPRRTDPRKARSRAALIGAALEILAENPNGDVSIEEITRRANVGFGTFYGHFDTKPELFEAAVQEMLAAHIAAVDEVIKDVPDPAERYIIGMRLTVRLGAVFPGLARAMIQTLFPLIIADEGVAQVSLDDLKLAVELGRFKVGDPAAANATVAGGLLGLLQYFEANPRIPIDEAADDFARAAARMLGMTPRQADAIVARPIPVPNA